MLSSLLETFVENCPAAVAMLDTEMRYLLVSRRWLEDYRLLASDIIGRCHYDVFPEITSEWKDIHKRCLRGAVESNEGEAFLRADGTVDWVKWEARPWMAPDGAVGGLLMMTEVITKRVESELLLRRSEETFRALFELSPMGMVQADPSTGRFLKVNLKMCEITGFTQEELLSLEPTASVHRLTTVESEEHSTSEPACRPREMKFIRADGQQVWVRVHPTMIKDAGGRTYLSMAAVKDISTEMQAKERAGELETQIRQSQKLEAIGQLAGGVAHDFNNILSSILIEADIAIEDPEMSEDARESLVSIIESGTRAANLTRQLLLFSRKQDLREPTCLDLNALVERLLKMLRRMVREDIELELKLPSTPTWVNADPGMMEQVLMNLVVNARDAMPSGGNLTVTLEHAHYACRGCGDVQDCPPGKFVRMTVRDTGTGIPDEVMARIFEPFFTTKAPEKGTGLGLSTVMDIVKQHQGCLKAESSSGGTTFTLHIPYAENAEKPMHVVPESKSLGGAETILLVEDEESVRRVVATLLTRNGYKVVQANDADQALDVWRSAKETIGLLLTDLVMPGEWSGRKLAETIRDCRPKLPVLFMSGYSEELVERGISTGNGIGFLAKPFQSNDLLNAVRRVLDQAV